MTPFLKFLFLLLIATAWCMAALHFLAYHGVEPVTVDSVQEAVIGTLVFFLCLKVFIHDEMLKSLRKSGAATDFTVRDHRLSANEEEAAQNAQINDRERIGLRVTTDANGQWLGGKPNHHG